jgi:endogenous inhibitor of DNA gyrase (YacG/DUF329 family)
MVIRNCDICGKEYKKRGKNPKTRFCSVTCKSRYQHLFNRGENHPRWKVDYIRSKVCSLCGKEFSNSNPTVFQVMKFCSKKCADLGGFRFKGKEHPNWRGGRRAGIAALRSLPIYKNWSRGVLKRDSFTCYDCGKVGGRLNAHHLKGFTAFPSLRYELLNGITLCSPCHAKRHRPKYGNKFVGTIENGVNSVELPMGQYRANLETDGVEVNPEIMDINSPSDNNSERYDPSKLAIT